MSTETTARPAEVATPKPTEFTDAEHSMLDAMNVPTNRQGRALLFREMQRTGLDPFAKHLYLREDWNQKANRNVYAVASTIDGFRIVAARQATYEGQTAPQWCDRNGNWTDAWWADAAPVAARIGVYVRGYREPMWGIARFNEYKPGGNAGFMWSKMAAHMIAKVAEALAIRKAYPDQLSGVYTDDEMQQADARNEEQGSDKPARRQQQRQAPRANDEWNQVPPQAIAEQQDRDAEASQELPPPSPMVPTITPEQLGEMARLLKQKRGAVNGDRNRIISTLVRRPVADVQTLSQAEARTVIETLTAEPDHVPLPTVPAVPEPTEPLVRRATEAQKKMMWATITEQGHTHDGGHLLMSRILRREITSTNQLTFEDASTVINALGTGEIPPPLEPEPAGPNANGEGIDEFDVLDQMIRDVHDQQSQMDAEDAIAAELNRNTITEADAGRLRERLAAHVEQAQAGARS